MNEASRDVAISRTWALAQRAERNGRAVLEGLARVETLLTGTASRALLLSGLTGMLGAFFGCALFHMLFGR